MATCNLPKKDRESILQGMKHVVAYISYITGETEEDHLMSLDEVQKRFGTHAVKGKKKCRFSAEGRIPGILHHEGWNFPNNGQGKIHQGSTSTQG